MSIKLTWKSPDTPTKLKHLMLTRALDRDPKFEKILILATAMQVQALLKQQEL